MGKPKIHKMSCLSFTLPYTNFRGMSFLRIGKFQDFAVLFLKITHFSLLESIALIMLIFKDENL